MNKKVANVVDVWIKSIIARKGCPMHIIDPNFGIEDGMTLQEYWDYECYEFGRLSCLFDINEKFNIKITNSIVLTQNKSIYFIWLYNKLGRLSFKFNMTITNDGLLSSNEYRSQQVLKCSVESGKIKNVKMMLRGKVLVKNIICSQLQLEGIFKTETSHIDGFYLSQFIGEDIDSLLDTALSFHLMYEDGIKTKVKMVLEGFNTAHKPYLVEDGIFMANANAYPVNLVVYKLNGDIEVVESPRDVKIKVNEIKNIIMTDVLDNDWLETFN